MSNHAIEPEVPEPAFINGMKSSLRAAYDDVSKGNVVSMMVITENPNGDFKAYLGNINDPLKIIGYLYVMQAKLTQDLMEGPQDGEDFEEVLDG